MKKTILVFMLFLLNACASKPLCPVVTTVSDSMSGFIAARCGCDQTAVQASIFPIVNVGGMCNTAGGPIAGVVCPLAASELAGLLGSTFPASWKCTNASSCVGTILTPLTTLCESLPFAPKP